MRLPFFQFTRDRSESGEGLVFIRSIFSKFKRILKLNTRALELMAEMERALGGEYIFDRAFLESSVRELSRLTYQVIYSLNAMSENRYIALYDQFQGIKSTLEDVLGGGPGPFASSLTLPYSALGWEMEPLVGTLNVCLAEVGLRLDLAPDGFAVTTTGCRLFMEANGIDEVLRAGDQDELGEILARATMPVDLEEALLYEVRRFVAGRDGPVRFSVHACGIGEHGESLAGFNGAIDISPEEILEACRSVMVKYIEETSSVEPSGPKSLALAVHEAVSAHVAGSITSEPSAEFPAGLFNVTAESFHVPGRAEHYLLRRVHPFDMVQSSVSPLSLEQPGVSVSKALSQTSKGLYRGSAILDRSFLEILAESAVSVERLLGCPQELEWAGGDTGRPIFVGIRPSKNQAGDEISTQAVPAELGKTEVLLRSGETVQAGISAGRAVHISEQSDLGSFPHGAVAVARVASPRLTPVLRRASAIVTELGTSISHLAMVAREMRVPAIFGACGALERIDDGTEVTVDALERTVYRGIVEPLLVCGEYGSELYPRDPEYLALRRLLRWIIPIEVVDPESSDFTAENCKTYHEILHFAHERSVDELLRIQNKGIKLTDLQAGKLELGVPLDLLVIDLGGGISSVASDRISLQDILSEPFRSFFYGLAIKDMWNSDSAPIRLRDIFAGMDRTFAALTNIPEYSGLNHAIVAANYMNVGLRLGYHFSVIDAYQGNNAHQNYIYFRFVGGFADERRRRFRAELIRAVLEEMRFKVMVKGDLVVGKLKIANREEMSASLIVLGELTGFTRQLDLCMFSEEKISRLAALFREKSVHYRALCSSEEPGNA